MAETAMASVPNGGGAPTSGDDVLDRPTLERLLAVAGEDAPLKRSLIESFLASADQHLASLQAACDRDDPAAAELPAHSLKSSSAMFGATTLSSLCAAIEREARSGVGVA
ncbi:MAG: Hpt domain-containing protein, partial [Dehalococcoidia bacterium]|nr:Hpt domain-containing protein [Dehalococcoidia bacterium]